jgi:hypothetical protein
LWIVNGPQYDFFLTIDFASEIAVAVFSKKWLRSQHEIGFASLEITFGIHWKNLNPLTPEVPIFRMNWVEYERLNYLPIRDEMLPITIDWRS